MKRYKNKIVIPLFFVIISFIYFFLSGNNFCINLGDKKIIFIISLFLGLTLISFQTIFFNLSEDKQLNDVSLWIKNVAYETIFNVIIITAISLYMFYC